MLSSRLASVQCIRHLTASAINTSARNSSKSSNFTPIPNKAMTLLQLPTSCSRATFRSSAALCPITHANFNAQMPDPSYEDFEADALLYKKSNSKETYQENQQQMTSACDTDELSESFARNESEISAACPFHNSQTAELAAIQAVGCSKATNPQAYRPAPGAEGERPVSLSTSLVEAIQPLASWWFHKLNTITGQEAELTDGVKSFDDIPGPRGLPVIGNVIKYSKLGPFKFDKVLENRLTYVKKFGRIYRERLGMMEMVHLFDPTDIATMFRLEGKHPSRGLIANLELTYLQRNNKLIGFAFLDGPEWERQRACIQQLMMKPLAAAEYLRWQWPVAQDFTDYLGSLRDSNNLVTDLQSSVFKYTMESIGAVCFGDRIGSFGPQQGVEAGTRGDIPLPDSSEVHKLPGYISETLFCLRSCMFNFPFFRYFRSPMYKRFENASNEMRRIMSKYIGAVAKRVDESKRLTPCSDSQTDLIMENNARQDDEDLLAAVSGDVDQVKDDKDLCILKMLMEDPRVSPELAVNLCMALFRTGIDSTGNALLFFMHNLASNPDKQKILYDEITSVMADSNSTTPTIEVLQKLPYLRACLRESFRLNFPVYGGSGRVMPEDTVFSGYNVPKGTFIFANLATMSRMEEYFPKADEFHPERWLRDERATLQSQWPVDSAFLSLPFSHGLRACPGKRFAEQGIYMAAIAIMQRYRLETDNSHMEMINMPFTIPGRSVDIRFVPRDQAENHTHTPSTSSLAEETNVESFAMA